MCELKWLANEAADLRPAHGVCQHLLAVGAGENHSYSRPGPPGLRHDFSARRTRNRHVQQDQVDVASIRTNQVDGSRAMGRLQYVKAGPAKRLHHCLPRSEEHTSE